MKTLLRRLVGWCLALLGWATSLVFCLVDWAMDRKEAVEHTPEAPFPGPAPVKEPANVVTPDRFDQEAANRIADEFLVMDLLYEVCDDWEANHG